MFLLSKFRSSHWHHTILPTPGLCSAVQIALGLLCFLFFTKQFIYKNCFSIVALVSMSIPPTAFFNIGSRNKHYFVVNYYSFRKGSFHNDIPCVISYFKILKHRKNLRITVKNAHLFKKFFKFSMKFNQNYIFIYFH